MADLPAGTRAPGSDGVQADASEPCREASSACAARAAEALIRVAHVDSDRELLRRTGGGDREAFRELYLDYHGRLGRFLSRVIRNQEEIEELINDVLLIVWQHARNFRGASRVSTWIFGIAYRCALMATRRSTARARATEVEFRGAEAPFEDAARRTEERQLVDLGLSRLPPEQSLVLILAYRMDYSCEEIAAISECPVNTVKTRMFHARRKLRRIIAAAATPAIPACPPGTARG